jgi:hypothetical protein
MAKTVEAKPRNDAYTGLLAISLLALLGGCVLMYLDQDELGKAPGKNDLRVDVPGATKGAGSGLPPRVDPGAAAGGVAPVPAPGPMGMPPMGTPPMEPEKK